MYESLESFHPLVADWFVQTYAKPTEIQDRAWPVIAEGGHVLLTAPTGTGKTLAAFLWAIDRLLTRTWETGAVRVLYVSPLKALNNDIRVNLLTPLTELAKKLGSASIDVPEIRVMTRSGDTPQNERQRMLRRPPEILITTPESLNLLLSSPRAIGVLSGVRTVILDEIHAVAGEKRGTHLISAVERLSRIAGEFQRIALSATVRPLEAVAEFVSGYTYNSVTESYVQRPIQIVRGEDTKKLTLSVRYLAAYDTRRGDETVWDVIAAELKTIVAKNTSTLIFVNSRRLTERIARLINSDGEMIAYAHHGSLAKEFRRLVEDRLKAGELKAIVATSSLEMGIDIGSLDTVLLVETPFSVSSAVQRLGRSGHGVGRESLGVLFPSHPRDLLDAVVMRALTEAQDIEPLKPVRAPLDVLAQNLVSMTGIEKWRIDDLFTFLRRISPYNNLDRNRFDSVLEMLAGRYQETRVRELRSRITVDREARTVEAVPGALLQIYAGGGTIPDRGYYRLTLAGARTAIGELDEEFVWERTVGDVFHLGTQPWRITRIDHQRVEVEPSTAPITVTPFWKGEQLNRDTHYAGKVAQFLEECSALSDRDDLEGFLSKKGLDQAGAETLANFLARQKAHTGVPLPHRHHVRKNPDRF